jgi:hypothetical protein
VRAGTRAGPTGYVGDRPALQAGPLGAAVLIVEGEPGAKNVFRVHARDVNLVMRPGPRDASIPFRVAVDGEPPGDAHGLDVDE